MSCDNKSQQDASQQSEPESETRVLQYTINVQYSSIHKSPGLGDGRHVGILEFKTPMIALAKTIKKSTIKMKQNIGV